MNKTMDPHFEAWARKMSMDLEHRNIPGVGKFYECPRTLLAFEAWQASREAIEVVLPHASVYPRGKAATQQDYFFDQGQADGLRMARNAIESLGLKVKP